MATKQEFAEKSSSKNTDTREKKTRGETITNAPGGVVLKEEKALRIVQPKLEPSSIFFVQETDQELAYDKDQRKCFGLIETRGFLPLVVAADAMLKAANIHLIRYERVLGELAAICVVGDISAVRIAVESGIASAQNYGEVVASAVLSNPAPVVAQALYNGQISLDKEQISFTRQSAIGLLEARGFVCAIVALDSMLKAASVNFCGLENTGAGTVSPIITGDLSAVKYAVEAGVQAAGRIGQVIASQVLARPQVTKEEVLPLSEAKLFRLIPPSAGR